MSTNAAKWIALVAAISLGSLSTAPTPHGVQNAVIAASLFVSAALLHVFSERQESDTSALAGAPLPSTTVKKDRG